MEIKYLKKLVKNSKIDGEKIEGVSEATIKKVENKFKIVFPQAYKEFLFLAGEYTGNLPIMDTNSLEEISADWHQQIMKEEMQDTGTKIERPFWLFAESNACEVFYFFYLDEKTDDPNVYLVNYGIKDRTRVIESLEVAFSEFINRKIDLAYKILKEGY